MSTTFLHLYLPAITDKCELEDLFNILSGFEEFRPAKYDTNEPIRKRFDKAKIADISKRLMGENSFLWKSANKYTWGAIDLREGRGKQSAALSVYTDIEKHDDPNGLTALLEKVVTRFGCTYGYIHYLAKEDALKWIDTGTVMGGGPSTHPLLGVSRIALRCCLPDLYWCNIFGPEYVDLFGRDRIITSPAPSVKELKQGIFSIQLSESALDFQTNYPEMNAIRERIKEHLGFDCFFNYLTKSQGSYRIPNLGWTEIPRHQLTTDDIMDLLQKNCTF